MKAHAPAKKSNEVAATAAAHAKIREALTWYETAMDVPVVRAIAKRHWGEVIPEGMPTAPWLHECRMCLSHKMRRFVTEEDHWDAFTIASIVQRHLQVFLPDSIRGDDPKSEMHTPDGRPVMLTNNGRVIEDLL